MSSWSDGHVADHAPEAAAVKDVILHLYALRKVHPAPTVGALLLTHLPLGATLQGIKVGGAGAVTSTTRDGHIRTNVPTAFPHAKYDAQVQQHCN